jgi:hypothetical protein
VNVGISLGLLIGACTGLYTFLLLTDSLPPSALAKVGLLGLPALWFGSPWLLGPVLKSIDWDHARSDYIFMLAVTWVPFALVGTGLRMATAGNLIGQQGGDG